MAVPSKVKDPTALYDNGGSCVLQLISTLGYNFATYCPLGGINFQHFKVGNVAIRYFMVFISTLCATDRGFFTGEEPILFLVL